jgi:hypothetical protein
LTFIVQGWQATLFDKGSCLLKRSQGLFLKFFPPKAGREAPPLRFKNAAIPRIFPAGPNGNLVACYIHSPKIKEAVGAALSR